LILKSRRFQFLFFQTLFGVLLLAAWLYLVDLGEVAIALSQARWLIVLLAAGVGTSSSLLRSLRWRTILRPIQLIPLLDLWLISLASSLINFIIPLRTGEVARSLFLRHRHRIPILTSLPTIAIDRSFDLLAVLLIGAIGGLTGINIGGKLSFVLLGAGLIFLGFVFFIAAAIFFGDRVRAFFSRIIPKRVDETLRNRLLGFMGSLIEGFGAVRRKPRDLVPILGISLLTALLDGVLFYLLFRSLSITVSLPLVLTGFALFTLTFLVPGAPGYVGSMEAFGSLVFGGLGIGQAGAASVVLLYHAYNVVMLGVAGGIGMLALGLRPMGAVRSIIDVGGLGEDANTVDRET
jgi:uncharacterized protein (TIRG00374 family)